MIEDHLSGNGSMPYLVIFDLDGTLIDGSKVHEGGARKAINQAKEEDNLTLNKTLEEIIEGQKGLTHEGFAKLIVKNSNKPNQSELVEKIANIKQGYVQEHAGNVTLYEGVMEILPELKKAGIKTAIFTSSDKGYTRKVLEKYQVLKDNIDYVLTGDNVKKPKPAPDGIYHIREKFKVPENAIMVYVGDARNDCESAQRAKEENPNLTFILYNPDKKDIGTPLGKGDITIHTLAELLPLYLPSNISQ
ncbi:MAG: HAD-IA family hydrolase [Flavobacteriales bacterium]|jgi:phosphoglycolate phosphatase|nr:HAD-IA family hydrolase [Flavobacteriales bacterium]|tara:strand:- start:3305 stop:4045 length:741 start_codon:yes stop_codon:yes gene_type:complete